MRESRENGQGDAPRPGALRRLIGRRKPLPRSDSERIAAVAHDAHVPVEEVLRDVAEFRLALETDMIIAAAAVDAESPETLSDVLDDERLELATFHDRLLSRLADAAAEDEIALRRDRRRPSKTVAWTARAAAAAAAVVAVLGGSQVVNGAAQHPATVRAADSVAMQNADQRYADFSTAVSGDSAVAVRAAARELHQTLETLIAEHADDPEVAQRAAQLLQAEIALLQINDPDGASQVLAQARSLVTMLKQAAPPQVRATVQPVLDAAISSRPSQKPKATPTASPTPKATASATPKATASASRSTDPDDDGPLDTP